MLTQILSGIGFQHILEAANGSDDDHNPAPELISIDDEDGGDDVIEEPEG
jgi:hypothetical protein